MRSSKLIWRTTPTDGPSENLLPAIAPSNSDAETQSHHLDTTGSGWWVKRSARQNMNKAGRPTGYKHQLMHGRKVIGEGVGADWGRTFRQQADFQNAKKEAGGSEPRTVSRLM